MPRHFALSHPLLHRRELCFFQRPAVSAATAFQDLIWRCSTVRCEQRYIVRVQEHLSEGTTAMRYGLIALAAAGVFGVSVTSASAQVCGHDQWGRYHCIQPAPGYGAQYAPPAASYDGDDYNGGYYAPPQRSEPPNPCPPYWTIQSGRCKPYRGY
jgi:hypothetical protein